MQKFWDKVDIRKEDDCWFWKGAKSTDKSGYQYGVLKINGKFRRANRISFVLTHNLSFDIIHKKVVCHSCDNTLCCNPKHLFLGTNLDNSQDMCEKNRSCRGERNGRHKLSENEVIDIKRRIRNNENCSEIAREYNVHQTTISLIKRNISWRYLISD